MHITSAGQLPLDSEFFDLEVASGSTDHRLDNENLVSDSNGVTQIWILT
jgi:hypothetical protein